jgi:tetratricopeptide (TPR) repeat protein
VRVYRRIIDAARTPPSTLVELTLAPDDDWYWTANGAILDRAEGLAAENDLVVAGLVVRPRDLAPEESVTDDFATRARQRGLAVVGIDPSKARSELRSAFVVMPYDKKMDPATDQEIDCNSVFEKLIVPALENADLDWQRADRSVDAGMIHVDMIDELGNADVVLADLVTGNPNVYYELGLRHALAEKVTVLIARAGTKASFDVQNIRRFEYRVAGSEVTDDEAIAGWAALAPILEPRAIESAGRDSPVFAMFVTATRPLRRRDLAEDEAQQLAELRTRVTLAEQQSRLEELHSALAAVKAISDRMPLSQSDLAGLLLRLGIALRYNGDYARAVEVLTSVRLAADHPAFVQLHRETGIALRRLGDRERDSGADPLPRWTEASDHLDQAFRANKRDPETLGITGGLHKQLATLAIRRGQRDDARQHLEQAESVYDQAVKSAPSNFYVMVNLIATSRLLTQHFDTGKEHLGRAAALLPIAEYNARSELRDNADFWATVTLAELMLTRHLVDASVSLEQVVHDYEAATRLKPPVDWWKSVCNQLELYEAAGDPEEVLAAVTAVLPADSQR